MTERDAAQGVKLGIWVKERREALRLRQDQVWERMEIEGDPNWLSLLESGRRKSLPDTEYLIGPAQALRVSVTDVLRGAGVRTNRIPLVTFPQHVSP